MTIPKHLSTAPIFSKNSVNTESYLKCYLYLDIFNENDVLNDVHNFLVSTLYLIIYGIILVFSCNTSLLLGNVIFLFIYFLSSKLFRAHKFCFCMKFDFQRRFSFYVKYHFKNCKIFFKYFSNIFRKRNDCLTIHILNHFKNQKKIQRSPKSPFLEEKTIFKNNFFENCDLTFPLSLQNDLPGLIVNNLPNKPFFLLLDSGSKFNILDSEILENYENRFQLNLPRFVHNIKLHGFQNENPLNILDEGVIFPIILKNSDRCEKCVFLPFLIHNAKNSTNILGFKSIMNLHVNYDKLYENVTINFEQTNKLLPDEFTLKPNLIFPIIFHDSKIRVPCLEGYTGQVELVSLHCSTACYYKDKHNPLHKCSQYKKMFSNSRLESSVGPFAAGLSVNPPTSSNAISPISLSMDLDSMLKFLSRHFKPVTEWDNHDPVFLGLKIVDKNRSARSVENLSAGEFNIFHVENFSHIFQNPFSDKESFVHDSLIIEEGSSPDSHKGLSPSESSECSQFVTVKPDVEYNGSLQPLRIVCNSITDGKTSCLFCPPTLKCECAKVKIGKSILHDRIRTRLVKQNVLSIEVPDKIAKNYCSFSFHIVFETILDILDKSRKFDIIFIGNSVLNSYGNLFLNEFLDFLTLSRTKTPLLVHIHCSKLFVEAYPDVVHNTHIYIKNPSLMHDSDNFPEDLTEPQEVIYLSQDSHEDFAGLMKNSNPNFESFFQLLFQCFSNVRSKSPTDLGEFLNPEFLMDLQLKNDSEHLLPRDLPFNTNSMTARICDIVVKFWEDCGLAEPSTNRLFGSRLTLARKHLNDSDFSKIKNRLFEDHDVLLQEKADIYTVNPDLFKIHEISKIFRVCLDSRKLNNICKDTLSISQNPETVLYSIMLNMSPDSVSSKRYNNFADVTYFDLHSSDPYKFPTWEYPKHDEKIFEELLDYANSLKKEGGESDSSNNDFFVSCLDVKAAHHTCKLTDRASYLLNFVTPSLKIFKFKKACFGLKSINMEFNSNMINILSDLISLNYCFLYADDVILFSRSAKMHALLLIEVLRRFNKHGVKLSINKSFLFVQDFIYLGYRFTKDGILLTDERIKGIVDFERPKNVKDIQRYLGVLNYISKFYPKFAKNCEPLTELLSLDKDFCWNEKQENAFQMIRKVLKENLKLNYVPNNCELNLYVDSSLTSGAGVLFIGTPGTPDYRPVIFISKKYSEDIVRKNSALECEIINLLYSLEKVRFFIESGRKIRVLSDAKAIVYILYGSRKSHNPRLTRLAQKLSEFPVLYHVQYCKPNIPEFQLVDRLSRQFNDDKEKIEVPYKEIKRLEKSNIDHTLNGILKFDEIVDYVEKNPSCVKLEKSDFDEVVNDPVLSDDPDLDKKFLPNEDMAEIYHIHQGHKDLELPNIIIEQSKDPKISKILEKIPPNQKLQNFEIDHEFVLKDGAIMKKCQPNNLMTKGKFQIYIPEVLLHILISSYHIFYGHVGKVKLQKIISIDYYHPQLSKIVFEMVGSCHLCLLCNKSTLRKSPITGFKEITAVNQLWAIDFFQMYNNNKFKHCLLILDVFSGLTIALPTTSEEVDQVIKALSTAFSLFSPPLCIQSDNAANLLKSKKVKKFLAGFGVFKTKLSAPYSCTHNPEVERRVKSYRYCLRILDEKESKPNWVYLLPIVNYILNVTPRLYYKDGKSYLISPFELYFRRPPPSSIPKANELYENDGNFEDLEKVVIKHTKDSKTKNMSDFNKTASKKPIVVPGDIFLYEDLQPAQAGRRSKKTLPSYLRNLYLCRKVIGRNVICEDLSTSNTLIVNTDFIKKYVGRQKYFDKLPKTIQVEMGKSFDVNLHLQSKEKIRDFIRENFHGLQNEKNIVNTRGKSAQKSIVSDKDETESSESSPTVKNKSLTSELNAHEKSYESEKSSEKSESSESDKKDNSKKSSLFKRLRNRIVKF